VAGSFSFVLTATEPGGVKYSHTYDLLVALNVGPSGGKLPAGSTGRAYATTLTSSGGTTPYRYLVQSGGLPPGLTMSQAGLIKGTPLMSGTYSVTILVLDNANPANEGQVTLTIVIT